MKGAVIVISLQKGLKEISERFSGKHGYVWTTTLQLKYKKTTRFYIVESLLCKGKCLCVLIFTKFTVMKSIFFNNGKKMFHWKSEGFTCQGRWKDPVVLRMHWQSRYMVISLSNVMSKTTSISEVEPFNCAKDFFSGSSWQGWGSTPGTRKTISIIITT